MPSPPPPRSVAGLSGPSDEWTASSVIRALQSESLAPLEQLAAWAQRGEHRDLDAEGAWGALAFYAALAYAVKEAWKAHDRAVLGAVGDDPHANFEYDQAHGLNDGVRHSRGDSGADDEEDELGDTARRGGAAVQEAWRRLQACYTILARVLSAPELQSDVARRRGGFDASFAGALMARFEPRYRKRGGAGSGAPTATQLAQQNLSAFTGVGGVAMGSVAAGKAGTASAGISVTSVRGGGGGGFVAPASVGGSAGSMKSTEPDSPQPQELSLLRGLLHSLYTKLVPLRPTLRHLMANFFQRFLRAPSSNHPAGVNEILQVYASIIRGAQVPLQAQHKDFLLKHLLPLHSPSGMISELAPVMQVYHESLVYTLIQFLEKDKGQREREEAAAQAAAAAGVAPPPPSAAAQQPSLCEQILTRILLGWPNARAANSPKEVLLLHECEKILEYCPTATEQQQTTTPAAAAASSDPSVALGSPSSPPNGVSASSSSSSPAFHRIITHFLPYLLQCLTSFNHRVAERALQLWQNDRFVSLCRTERGLVMPAVLPALLGGGASERHWNGSVNKMRAVVLGMWRDMDLVLFTTVAHRHFQLVDGLVDGGGEASSSSAATPADSLARADRLIESLKPPESLAPPPTAQSLLEAQQVRVASSLPPRVKYSDFVFGQLLGEGSFSQVRYAKWIQKGMMPSQWPEFAVKILSKELVAQQHYGPNLSREIKIMHLLAHENINRLVALCENATNTYLVLEYAPRGDLHTVITALGSLDTQSARFVAAEILRGMEEIHRNSIVYVDLKPENVLVHASGHVKLSDFGSSRFFDEVGSSASAAAEDSKARGGADRLEGTADYLAPELLRGEFAVSPASDLWAYACVLYQMLAGRTPIWAEEIAVAAAAADDASSSSSADSSSSSMSAEEREAARNAAMLAHEEAQKSHMLSKMVQFEAGGAEDRFPENFDPAARALIEAIMLPDPARRIGVRRRQGAEGSDAAPTKGVAWEIDYSVLRAHPFFEGIDFAALPTLPAPSLSGGRVAPAPRDAQWARRKNSIMWAPMPRSYTFDEGAVVMEAIKEDVEGETAQSMQQQQQQRAGAGGSAGSRSLRAQMFGHQGGAPRLPGLSESPLEGSASSTTAAMDLTEGDEEGEDDEEDDDDEPMNGGGSSSLIGRSSRLQGSMMAAPLPSSSGSHLPPRPPGKASSRASGPMAVVEHPREEDELAGGAATGTVIGSGPPMRAPVNLRAGSHSAGLPPSGAGAGAGGMGGGRPGGSFVPLADATAGPRGLGMGLRRQMGGSATASALLARVLNKPTNMHPMAPLPETGAPPQHPTQP